MAKDGLFLYTNHCLIDHHFEKIIIMTEGTTYSADKGRYLLRQLFRHLVSGAAFDLSKDGKQYTYHMPDFWLDNGGQEWISLFDSLYQFKFGNYEPYIRWCKKYLIPLIDVMEGDNAKD